jgi:hypothetical protein
MSQSDRGPIGGETSAGVVSERVRMRWLMRYGGTSAPAGMSGMVHISSLDVWTDLRIFATTGVE